MNEKYVHLKARNVSYIITIICFCFLLGPLFYRLQIFKSW